MARAQSKHDAPLGEEAPSGEATEKKALHQRPIWEVVAEIGAQIPDELWKAVPDDGSINYRHYLYGVPKKKA